MQVYKVLFVLSVHLGVGVFCSCNLYNMKAEEKLELDQKRLAFTNAEETLAKIRLDEANTRALQEKKLQVCE